MNKNINKYLLEVPSFLYENWKVVGVALILLALTGGWYVRAQIISQPTLTFVQPINQDLSQTIDIAGSVDAKEKARVRFIAGGKVVYLGAQEGDEVRRGQTIATIDRATLEKQLSQDLNIYLNQRATWDNTLDDTKDRWLDNQEQRSVDSQQRILDNRVIDIEIRDIAIRNSALASPFNGILTFSPTAVTGVQLLANDYFEIVNPNSIILRAFVDEIDIALIQIGQSASIVLDAYPNETIEAQVSYVAYTSSQTSSGTAFLVEFEFAHDNNLNKFRIGMNGDISITIETVRNSLTIPYISTRERSGVFYVDIKTSDRTFEEREIKIGLETDDAVEVLSGLSKDDEVLLPN